jgi:ABC-type branched-subunit amino acid transport system substrate-binding protein
VFEEKSVARAISEGVDTGGNRLDPVMPRYSMSWEDMTSLLAWLKRLEDEHAPGVTDLALRVGIVLPTRGQRGEVGQAMSGVLRAYFDELNAAGGIHGRKLEPVFLSHDSDRETGLESLRRQLAQEPVFALLSGFVPGAEQALAELAEREKLPLIGPLTRPSWAGDSSNPYVFSLLSGPREQAPLLAEYATRELHLDAPRVAILHPQDVDLSKAASAARERFQALGWKQVELLGYGRGGLTPARVAELKRKGTRVVMFLGGDAELTMLTGEAQALAWAPYLLLPGTLSARAAVEAPTVFQGRIFLASPTSPSDERPHARETFSRLRSRVRTSGDYRMAQVSAYTAAVVLTEGLRRTGRQVSRKKLLDHLEHLYAFDAGLVPPLSYGPNRRVGAAGAYIVTVDLQARSFRPVSGWMTSSREE